MKQQAFIDEYGETAWGIYEQYRGLMQSVRSSAAMLRHYGVTEAELGEGAGEEDPRGICLEESATIIYPDGCERQGAVWQHTEEGDRGIYALIPWPGGETAYALTPMWHIEEHKGMAVLQGM